MVPIINYQQRLRRLMEPNLPLQMRLQIIVEIRENLEIIHTAEYYSFLQCYLRAFAIILTRLTNPQLVDGVENRFRGLVLDILRRLPQNEVLRPFVTDLLRVSLQVLTKDNEENALIALRIMLDLFRHFQPAVEAELQTFLDFIGTIHRNFLGTVSYCFCNSAATAAGGSRGAGGNDIPSQTASRNSGAMISGLVAAPDAHAGSGGSRVGDDSLGLTMSDTPSGAGSQKLNPSTRSFKFMKECPVVIICLYKIYPKLVEPNIARLLPLVINIISFTPPVHVPPHLRSDFIAMKGAQVKALSFLSYMLAKFSDHIKPHEGNLCKSIVNLLVTCPDDASLRRELLLSLKHVLATELRRGLFPYIDTLSDESALVGTGRTCVETLRPLASSVLAETVHHVRTELSLPQLSRIIYLFSRNLHDPLLNVSIHTTSARLMLNLVEPVYEKGDRSCMDESRILLGRILDAFVGKFSTLKRTIPQILEGDDRKVRSYLRLMPEAPIQTVLNLQPPLEHSKEVTDYKNLIKTLVMGMKTIIWSITNPHVPRQVSPSNAIPQAFKGMREDEVRKTSTFLKTAVHCLALLKEKDEERITVQYLSQILSIMDSRDLMDTFYLCMPELFDYMVKNNQLLHMFSTLLQHPKVLQPVTEALVNFLVGKLDVLKQVDTPMENLVLRLFHILFVAASKAPAECERKLQPHITGILEVCMKNATKIDAPRGYMQLLRIIFRSLNAGKFELILRDLVPLLHPCLDMLLAMVDGPTGVDIRDLVLELCLTLPAFLSSLLPHLSRLMKPLVLALKGNTDLISLGLRTLEYWIDSLNPNFLEPSMANVMSELILSLWSHLRPAPYPWGGKVLRLLGKLGGRNRRFLKDPLTLDCKENLEHGLRLILTFEPSTQFLVPLDRCVYLALASIMRKSDSVDSFCRKQTLKFLRACLASFMNIHGSEIDEKALASHLGTLLLSSIGPSRRRDAYDVKGNLGAKTKTQLKAEKFIFKILLMAIISTSSESDMQDGNEFVVNICQHFAMIFHVYFSCPPSSIGHQSVMSYFSRTMENACLNLKELDPFIFIDAIVDVLAHENRIHAKSALRALNVFADTLLLLARSKHCGVINSRGAQGTPKMVSSPSIYPVSSLSPSFCIHVFEQLLPRLLHSCYGNTWQAQIGGVRGLGALVGKVSVDILYSFQVRIVRGLVYVLKRLPAHANSEREEATLIVTQVLRVVSNVDEANNQPHKKNFQCIVEYFASELFNPYTSITVRKTVQSFLALLASRTGSEVTELLESHYSAIIHPLILRPLRSKNIEQQVGTITALNFSLGLRPPLLRLSPELVNILQEALEIAEADETVWGVKVMDLKVVTTLNELRTACVELLSTSMAWADLKTAAYADMRVKIISMFFKSLTCTIPEIVAIAKEGLRQVLQRQKLPKELIQSSIKLIFVNLRYAKNLTVPLLQGLARLLELSSIWFNVSLGAKLLDHLKEWLQPEKLAQAQKSWNPGDIPKVPAAVIELFHLLPSAAGKYLDVLVSMTIDLEAALPEGQFYSEINSPYRLPLAKFLNRYATDAVEYFLERLNQPKYVRRFIHMIRLDVAQPLREELSNCPPKLLGKAFPQYVSSFGHTNKPSSASEGDELMSSSSNNFTARTGNQCTNSEAYFHGLYLTCTLVKLMPDWLQNNRMVFDTLVKIWKSPGRISRLKNELELDFLQVKESKWLVKCFINYIRHYKSEVSVLFDMLSIFLSCTRIDFTFLKEFYVIEVVEGYPPNIKKTILLHFLSLFQKKQLEQKHLVVTMQMLILPMLAHSFQNGQNWEVVDSSIIKTIVHKILDPPEQVSVDYDETLRIELLQLATLLLKYMQDDLVHHRKELINFCLNHLKREDDSCKQWAFVNICHFFEAYQASEKIKLQVFNALLRNFQPENKVFVKQALDILIPTFSKRLQPSASGVPSWILHAKKTLIEEGHSIPNLIHIFQLIVRHSDLFYSCRALFVPQMINSLARLAIPQSSTIESRRLAIDIAGLVMTWERQRQNELKVEADTKACVLISDVYKSASAAHVKRQIDATSISDDVSKGVKVEPGLQSLCMMPPASSSSISIVKTPASTSQADKAYKPNSAMKEMIINFLIRVAYVMDLKEKVSHALYTQTLDLLSQALEMWPNVNVKVNYLEKLLVNIQPSRLNDPSKALAQGLDIMSKVLEKQPHTFIKNNINHISQILEHCFNSKALDAGKSLCALLKIIFVAFPLEAIATPQDVRELYQRVQKVISNHLAVVTLPQAVLESGGASSVIGYTLLFVTTLTEVQKNFINPFLDPLVRVLQCLARDLLSSVAFPVRQDQRAHNGNITGNIQVILKLILERAMRSPESKQSICETLHALLSEKSTESSLLLCILETVKNWIEEDFRSPAAGAHGTTATQEDIVSFLERLSQVDRKSFSPCLNEEWDSKYLQLLYELCADSSKYSQPLCLEVFRKVEMQFMLGLTARDPETRQRFFSLYHESLGKSLFDRLQYILQFQDWEAVSDTFWLKQGMDLLLGILVENEPIYLAPNAARVPPLLVHESSQAGRQYPVMDRPNDYGSLPPTFDCLVTKHAQFLKKMSKLNVSDLMTPLRELAHTDANVAYHMWVLVFPMLWHALEKSQQKVLVKPIIYLLSKDYHKKQKASRPNVVQALLEGLYLSCPQPRMPSELIKFIGKTYNAWHISISLLESHLYLNDSKCSESLAELYRLLNEEDMRFGLWKRGPITEETRAGLSLVQHGYWQQAQNLFHQAMIKATQGTYTNSVPLAEMRLWEEQWINCASQLSQWDALSEFGKSVENYDILLDALWKIPDWTYMKEYVLMKAHLEETPKFHLLNGFFSLHDSTSNGAVEAENIVGKGVERALEQWSQLPEVSIQCQMGLLQQFQQLVELHESAKIISEITNGNKEVLENPSYVVNNGYIRLKDILGSWRLRTPNEWDNFSVWYDLLHWRNEIYNAVIDMLKDFASNNPLLNLIYRDKARNVNKLAHVARKQSLHDVCLTILNTMYGHSIMNVQEAFVHIREQAKAYLEMKGELSSGLNLINNTNLEQLPAKHKAEIFHLKGDFLVKMDESENANLAYSSAIILYEHLAEGWISWGNYCDKIYKETREGPWLEYTVNCFLQGIKYGVSNSRSHLARVLYLLSFDLPSEPVGRTFDKYLDQLPYWVWLLWIPQLLVSLQRAEAPHCKLVLIRIAQVYPQALYYWLRTYFKERRDVPSKTEAARNLALAKHNVLHSIRGTSATTNGVVDGAPRTSTHMEISAHQIPTCSTSGASHNGGSFQVHEQETASLPEGAPTSAASEGPQTVTRCNYPHGSIASTAGAFEAAKDIMEALRNKHANLASQLEALLSEIGSKFVTLPEERLLAVVNALLHRCYKYPTATTTEVPQSLKKELAGLCKACFSQDAIDKHVDFVREYKHDFERDFDPENVSTFPATLDELIEKIKLWKNVLQSNVEDRFPAVLKLEDESKFLCDFNIVDVEIPGQYFNDQEVAPDHTVKLDKIGADIPIVRRHGSSFRRLTLIGSDGSQRPFIVQTSLTSNARSDERTLQLFRLLNRMFDKHKESRRRHLHLHTPIIVPVWSQVRMVEDDLMYSTFLEVYEINCARNNLEADLPVKKFKQQLNKAISGQISPEAVVHLRLQAYTDIISSDVKDNIFSQYMSKTILNGNHLWVFKKQFAIQLALSCFMSYMLQIGGRSPNKILFAKNSGRIFQTDFHPAYDVNGMIEFFEPVPFRLTRNMQAFFSNFGVEALIVSAMCSAAQAVAMPKKNQHLWFLLAMFFRDELLSWSWRRPIGIPSAQFTAGGINIIDLEQKIIVNVEHVIGRIKEIAPQFSSEEDDNALGPALSVQKGVLNLVEAALAPRNLCVMDPTWHPWF